jgi:cytochrome c-type biogenesis protein
MAFGAGWTPCIGPILAGILFLAGQSGEIARGALLLGAFSIGLGLPFILASIFFPAFLRWLQRVKRHLDTIRVASGVFLIGIGILIAMGRLQTLNATVISAGSSLGAWAEANPVGARVVLGSAALGVAALPVVWGIVRRLRREGAPLLGRAGTVFAALFALIAGLQFAGVVEIAEVLEQWLTFQGI